MSDSCCTEEADAEVEFYIFLEKGAGRMHVGDKLPACFSLTQVNSTHAGTQQDLFMQETHGLHSRTRFGFSLGARNFRACYILETFKDSSS